MTMNVLTSERLLRVRIIIPAFPENNIYKKVAGKTTALGPVMVATCASMVEGFVVEVVDENNWHGERGLDGLPDHKFMQEKRPADIVGFYLGLSSTAPRVWNLASFYKDAGVRVIAGGRHAYYMWQETLSHNCDLVVHGAGEEAIKKILNNLKTRMPLWHNVPGVSYWCQNKIAHNAPSPDEALVVKNLDFLPYPDFGLLMNAKISIYPIGMTRGCRFKCEFCSVNEQVCSSGADYFFRIVEHLVETRSARQFFIVDDRLEEDVAQTIRFFELVRQRYGDQLIFTVQIRAEAAKNARFLEAMKKAGVVYACVGCESAINEELRAMNKGFKAEDMLSWLKVLRRHFRVHGMFIFAYPLRSGQFRLGIKERYQAFVKFIRKAKLGSVQVLIATPLPGTGLRERLEKEGRIFNVPWERYDGTYITFRPDEGITARQVQEFALRLMSWYYNPWTIVNIASRILFPIGLIRGWKNWSAGWYRDVVRYCGSSIVKHWRRSDIMSAHLAEIEKQ